MNDDYGACTGKQRYATKRLTSYDNDVCNAVELTTTPPVDFQTAFCSNPSTAISYNKLDKPKPSNTNASSNHKAKITLYTGLTVMLLVNFIGFLAIVTNQIIDNKAIKLHLESIEERLKNLSNESAERITVIESLSKITTENKRKTILVEEASNELQEEMRIVNNFQYVGRGYGRNSRGLLEISNSTATSSVVQCLLFCYRCRKEDEAINGANLNRDDYHCRCERNTDTAMAYRDNGFLHYVHV